MLQPEGATDEPREEDPLASSESVSKVENAEQDNPSEPASAVAPASNQNDSGKSSSTKSNTFGAKPRKAKRKRTKPKRRKPTNSVSAVMKRPIATSGKEKDKSLRPSTPTPPFPMTSVFSPDEEPSFIQLNKFSILLENRTFVDYFNVFLSMPVRMENE
ncbi:hypothetical protein ACJMK2_010441 [Sinanodonta woodiana]|uniref:Uncharacterized protein n=1 Tax=Sinanodonta woodiana TaxID=1069815 RepID=A0ABD3VIB9_SINWO